VETTPQPSGEELFGQTPSNVCCQRVAMNLQVPSQAQVHLQVRLQADVHSHPLAHAELHLQYTVTPYRCSILLRYTDTLYRYRIPLLYTVSLYPQVR